MGYYVRGHGSLSIDKNDIDKAYEAMCELNDHDDMKRGGRYGGVGSADSVRPDGLNYHPGKWFSWMDPNYPDTCPTFEAVLKDLGFDFSVTNNGDVSTFLMNYDNKTGQEDLFMEAIAPFVISGEFEWSGEDGHMWKWEYVDGKMEVLAAHVVYRKVDS